MASTSNNPPAFDSADVAAITGSSYPAHLRAICEDRVKRRLGDHGGLTQFGVNLVHLPPGAGSALRHWHSEEDEFVYILSGELVLRSNAGEQHLRPGMAACFRAGRADGHQLLNRSDREASYLEVGSRKALDHVVYPDDGMERRPVEGGHRFFLGDEAAG